MNKMTMADFISLIQSKGALIMPPSNSNTINVTNTYLKETALTMLPSFLIDLYYSCSGITLGSACIFGPTENDRGIKYPLPSIISINQEIKNITKLSGRIVFGRNDLFWFATDALGNCVMLDNLTLSVLRNYDDVYRAMMDCLIVGKI